jgi:hypothetical protein
MKHITLALTVAITLVVAGEVSAKSVWIDVTPDNIDHQPLAFTIHIKDVKEGKQFEITVKPKVGKLPPARFLEPRFNNLRDDPKITEPTVKRVDREGESVVFSFQISQKDLEGARFSVWKMSYVEMKDEGGNAKLVPMPSATIFIFSLKDFSSKPDRQATEDPVPPQKPVP